MECIRERGPLRARARTRGSLRVARGIGAADRGPSRHRLRVARAKSRALPRPLDRPPPPRPLARAARRRRARRRAAAARARLRRDGRVIACLWRKEAGAFHGCVARRGETGLWPGLPVFVLLLV